MINYVVVITVISVSGCIQRCSEVFIVTDVMSTMRFAVMSLITIVLVLLRLVWTPDQ